MTDKCKLCLERLVEQICEFERAQTLEARARLREACWIQLEDVLTCIVVACRVRDLAEPSGQPQVGADKPASLV